MAEVVTPYLFPMIILNLIAIVILFIIYIYLFQSVGVLQEKMKNVTFYHTANDRIMRNLVNDINYNDVAISSYVNSKHS